MSRRRRPSAAQAARSRWLPVAHSALLVAAAACFLLDAPAAVGVVLLAAALATLVLAQAGGRAGRRGWRLDDWMRPHQGGRYPAPRQVSVRDRQWALVRLVLWLIALLVLVVGDVDGAPGYIGRNVTLMMSLFEVVTIVRGQRAGWRS